MMSRILLLLTFAIMALCSQAFTLPVTSRMTTATFSSTLLEERRRNAKKEKVKRNRENMRKFATGGPRKKGLSRRKLLKKSEAAKERKREAEYMAKVFITCPPMEEPIPFSW
mmetsp:Transcript_28856/g.33000  ORF Transcript_28856/g.33000 Transcript_28856/m.33000 type:complete len:112 (+) Transcript_28856:161-496(+)